MNVILVIFSINQFCRFYLNFSFPNRFCSTKGFIETADACSCSQAGFFGCKPIFLSFTVLILFSLGLCAQFLQIDCNGPFDH